jgi:pyrimidine-nucleoside phosphorylase
MVKIGVHAEREVVALISDMNQPLGYAVGNALEVREALDTLSGAGPEDFREHCLEIAGHMLRLAEAAKDFSTARTLAEGVLADGRALEKFRQLVEYQGGDLGAIDDPEGLPTAPIVEQVNSQASGYLHQQHAREIGLTAMELGAGRATKSDPVDHAVGIMLHHKVGDQIKAGESLFTVHAQTEAAAAEAKARLLENVQILDEACEPLPLFYETITD